MYNAYSVLCIVGCRQKEATKAGRKDAKLKDVVISERWDKKAAKFTTPALPFPFNSTEAFEGSMRHPLGSEFNTDASFRLAELSEFALLVWMLGPIRVLKNRG